AFWQSLHITSSSVEHIYAQIMSENIENRLTFMLEHFQAVKGFAMLSLQ
ncbi:EspG domain-containing protein, partial [Shigella sonnei]